MPEGATHAAPHARSSSPDSMALAALATIRDVGAEVGQLMRRTATRLADGTPVGSLLRTVLGEPAPMAIERRAPSSVADGDWAARVADAEQAHALGVQRVTELHERHEHALGELREARER